MRQGILNRLFGVRTSTTRGGRGSQGARQWLIERVEQRVLLSGSFEVEYLGEYDGGSEGTAVAGAPVDAELIPGSPAPAGSSGQAAGPAQVDPAAVTGVVYSNLNSNAGGTYSAFAPSSFLGTDDYNSINDANITLSSFQFIGGVSVANTSLAFEFHNSSNAFLGSFSANFDEAGAFIWTITPPANFVIPDAGILDIVAPSGGSGQWLLSTANPTVGTQSAGYGGDNSGTLSHKFEFSNGTTTTLLPDLQPAEIGGRPSPITISTAPFTTSDAGQIPNGSTVYVDYGLGNFGAGSAGPSTARLKLDGNIVSTASVPSIGSGFGGVVGDIELAGVGPGEHTLLMELDVTSAVAETSETNNTYSRKFFVGTAPNGEVHGFKWNDTDSDGVKDAGEAGLSNWTIFADLDNDGTQDGGEPSDVTDGTGAYDLLDLPTGVYTIREVLKPGFTQTFPGAAGQSNHDFEVDVVFPDSTLTPSQRAAFSTAAARWEQIITGDLPDVFVAGYLVDDVTIEATGPLIDGPSNILGQAGPRSLRPGSFLPISGIMQFDSADLAELEAEGALVDVILHEMGHVLGIGSIWDLKGLLTGAGGANPRFTGAQATAQYNSYFNPDVASVPVENVGGPGSRDSHWRESNLFNELMTSGYNGGIANPISRVTIGSLADLGYTVNLAVADAYTAPGASADTNAGEPLDGYFIGLDEEPVVVEPGKVIGGSGAAALPFTHQVHLNPGEVLNGINFGNVSGLPAWLGAGSAATWDAGTKALTVTGAATIIADPGADAPLITANGAGAVLTINPSAGRSVNVGGMTFTGGATATLSSLGAGRTAANSRVLVVNGNTFNIDVNSKLDLTDNNLILNYSGASPAAGVEAMVKAGFNGGNWLGNRITSSKANQNANFALSVSDNSSLTIPFSNVRPFAGQAVDTTAVLVKYTHRVDLDLDGVITTNDATIFNSSYNEGSAAFWRTGDLDFDSLFTSNDATLFNSFYNESLPPV